MELFAIVATTFVLAGVISVLRKYLTAPQQGWILSLFFVLAFVTLLAQIPVLQQQEYINLNIRWIPQLGLNLSLYLDGLSLFFALLVSGIAVAVFVYSGYYFDDARKAGHFLALLLAFTGGMLLLVLAGNVLTLFIGWEMTSIMSFLLIGFKGTDAQARRGASQALVITGGGGLALLLGLILLGTAAGSAEFTEILASGDTLVQSPFYVAITILILLGCFTKSAQFPFHFWLPGAMSAPSPASAFLHSATMVKAGIFLLLRLYPVLADTDLWTTALSIFGIVTMLVGATLALRQRDLKGLLAYSTISQLGALVALIGQPEAHGLKAAVIGILAHALYKCALFLTAGAIDHATGTRVIGELGGLRRLLPGFALVTAVACLSMAGVPPLLGFVAKETLLESLLSQPLLIIIAVVSSVFMVTLSLRLFVDVFLGQRQPLASHTETVIDKAAHDEHPPSENTHGYDHFHALPRLMVLGPALLALTSIVTGIALVPLVEPLVELVLSKDVKLYLLPPEGINEPLILSITVLIAGAVIFSVRRRWLNWSLPKIPSGQEIYIRMISGTEKIAHLALKSQSGRIRDYLVVILIAATIILVPVILTSERTIIRALPISITSVSEVLKAVLLFLALGATFASILFEKHLLAVLSLGIAGYSIGGIFLLEPAPDVALVQFLVETLATVLIIIILARTSEAERRRAMSKLWGDKRGSVMRDAVIAVVLGAIVTFFALAAVSSRPTPNPIAGWFLENALPQLGVTDVVAGVITDYRGMDTLLEITVFGMAALGVLTVLARPNPGKVMQLFRRKPEPIVVDPVKDAVQEDAERPELLVYRSRFNDPIMRLAAVLLLPISMMIAFANILYAGVAPGDGFTAGVICGLGITLWFVVFGYEETKRRLHWLHPPLFIGLGLLLAYVNALLPLLFGREFLALTQVTGLSFANIKLASSLVFEIGIFLAVFGGTNAILEAISHPKEVEAV